MNFVPLGTVLVAMLGVGVAEKSGLLGAGIRAVVLRAPRRLVTFVIVFAGVLSNTAKMRAMDASAAAIWGKTNAIKASGIMAITK